MDKYEKVKLKNQLCFPLYVCSKEIIKKYKPLLKRIDLTYTQYLVMMVLWEHNKINVTELGNYLYLDSGTLTPVLKKLENKELIKRFRSSNDERNMIIEITNKGENIKEEAIKIPEEMCNYINIDENEAKVLYNILYKIMKEEKKND